MTATRRGTLYGAGAYLLWGLFPLYWPLLRPSSAVEVLAHRIVWSLAVVALLLAVLRRTGAAVAALRDPRKAWRLVLAAVVIAVNWGTYIYGVSSDQVVETSLGYFVNPIVTVLMGVLVLRETLRPGQWAALGLAAVAVVVLTVENGSPPWIALVLAFSFGTYGLLKKTARVGAVEGLGVETFVLLVPAAAYVAWLGATGASTFGTEGAGHAALLAASGVITAIPLLLFGAAASRVPLTTLGILQYLAPTLQFLIGVLLYDEPMPTVKLVGFVLVWIALALFTSEAYRHSRRQLRLAVPQPA
ncbi:MAG TPA: EamA family transporter RarD [Mycobacteriales bacterium]|nr:EamA family transporter RarD [Mycobacteriales bacterium]